MAENTIFISYRRDDTAGHVGRLYDNFSNHFSPEQVFMDVDHIEPGEDFVKVIEDEVASCSVLVAVIGQNWLSSADGENRRLDNPHDFVRLEIAAALKRDIRVIPVLVNGAAIPRVQELPDDLTGLLRRHAHALGDGYRWKQDVDRLIKAIEKVFAAQRRLEETTQRRTLEEARTSADDQGRKSAEDEKERLRSENEVRLAPQAENRATESSKAKVHPGRRRQVILAAVGVLLATIIVALAYQLIFKNNRSSSETQNQSRNLGDVGSKGDAESNANPGTRQVPAGMTYVPGGTFDMGRNERDAAEGPAHQVTVAPFYIDIHEVTNEDYEKFVQATSRRAPKTWTNAGYPLRAARKPVTGVTWDDANAYAAWAKKRLPTEEEWEFAARGTDGRLYPWGDAWKPGLANADNSSKRIADVGSYRGTSPFRAFDMIGNAWEWTASDMRAYPRGHLPPGLPPGDLKVIRGGTYDTHRESATTTFRTGWPARGAKTYAQTGFRCAADISR